MKKILPNHDKMNHIRLIVCDLDGTLLNSHKKISKESAAYIIQLQKQGYHFALATGRFYYEVEPFVKQLHMEEYGGFVVCANGLEVYNTNTGDCHSFDSIPANLANLAIHRGIEHKLTMYVNEKGHFHVICSPFISVIVYFIKMILRPLSYLFKGKLKYISNLLHHATFSNKIEIKNDVPKICFTGRSKNIEKCMAALITDYPYLHFFYVNKLSVELCRDTVSKQYAIAYVCKLLKIQMEQVLAFGDSGNDEMLLSSVGIGVAMKNAYPSTKIVAPYENPFSNSENGVIKYLALVLGKQNNEHECINDDKKR